MDARCCIYTYLEIMSENSLSTLCKQVGYEFTDLELLSQALRHPSFTHENPQTGDHNQRLEFLGDAVVGLVVAEALIKRYPEAREGQLTRWRAALVSEKPLAQAAKEVGIGEYIMLGKGEDGGGGRDRTSLLCDAFEAVVGAAFLDGHLEAARTLVETVLGDRLGRIGTDAQIDHKSKLQEQVQAIFTTAPTYVVVNTSGPDHNKRFKVRLTLDNTVLGTGEGTSKKAAEQAAARNALERLDQEDKQCG